MSEKISGVVQAVNINILKDGRKSYDVVVGGQAYGCGLYPPKTEAGMFVTFDLDDSRGYKNVGRGSLQSSVNKGQAATAPTPQTGPTSAATTPYTASGGGDKRQDTISRQAASNTALQYLGLLLSQDAVAFPAAAKGAKKGQIIDAHLRKLEQQFYEDNTGVEWKSIAPKKAGAVDEDEAGDGIEADPADESWT